MITAEAGESTTEAVKASQSIFFFSLLLMLEDKHSGGEACERYTHTSHLSGAFSGRALASSGAFKSFSGTDEVFQIYESPVRSLFRQHTHIRSLFRYSALAFSGIATHSEPLQAHSSLFRHAFRPLQAFNNGSRGLAKYYMNSCK